MYVFLFKSNEIELYITVTRLHHLKFQKVAKFNLKLKYETGNMKETKVFVILVETSL